MNTGLVKTLDLDNVPNSGKAILIQDGITYHSRRPLFENGFQYGFWFKFGTPSAHVFVLQSIQFGSSNKCGYDRTGRSYGFDDKNARVKNLGNGTIGFVAMDKRAFGKLNGAFWDRLVVFPPRSQFRGLAKLSYSEDTIHSKMKPKCNWFGVGIRSLLLLLLLLLVVFFLFFCGVWVFVLSFAANRPKDWPQKKEYFFSHRKDRL
mmetsp:Transcript_153/g.333  ORF Transcript_153/g.333 Transcript_153/m.333 type:complete len:205 (+) Transcript_153:1212-1826(+)